MHEDIFDDLERLSETKEYKVLSFKWDLSNAVGLFLDNIRQYSSVGRAIALSSTLVTGTKLLN